MTDQPPPYYPPAEQEKAGSPPPQPVAAYPQPVAAYPQPVAAYPPQPVADYQPQQATTVVVAQQPVVQQSLVFRDHSVMVTDSNGQQVMTQLQFKSGMLTWLICCLICWITGLWCIAPVVFCIDATKDVYHITPTDGKIVGVYKRL